MKRVLRLSAILLMLLPLLIPTRSVLAADRMLRVTPGEWVPERVGEVTTVEVRVENVVGLYAAEIKLAFDPALVEVVTADGQLASRVEVGEMFTSSRKFEGANGVNNTAGTIHFLYTLLQQASGESGSGTVIRFRLRVKSLGDGAITIEKGDLVERSSDKGITSCTPTLHHGRLRVASPSQPGVGSSTGDSPGAQQTGQPTVPEASAAVGHVLSGSDLTVMSSSDVADGGSVNRTIVLLNSEVMRGAINAAAAAGCGMRVELPRYVEDATVARQEVSLQLPADELASLAQVGLDLVGPAGTMVQVPGALLQQLAADRQGFEFTSAQVSLPAANDRLQESGRAMSAEEIKANLFGPTTLRFPAPADADLATLRVRVIHSDGSVEDMVPTLRTDGDRNYLEIVVNRFSTFIIYRPTAGAAQPAEQPIAVKLTVGDRKALVCGVDYQLLFAPYIAASSGRTMVPVRFVSEALGATVAWEAATRTVRIADGGKTIVLTIDSRQVTVDGVLQQLDAPAVLRPGATYVPLRMVSEALGAAVKYDAASKQISISR